jgi:prepilin-type N-terminal cleavage/methylation domain-containing protein
MKKGFTLLELLIVLAILAVLLGIAVNNYQRYRSRLELEQAQQVFVQTLNRARSDAKRLSQNQTITWTGELLTIGEREVVLSESSGVTLVKITGANTLTYTAPYGRVASVGEYEFELQGRGDLTSKVYVYGVTGKVKAAR